MLPALTAIFLCQLVGEAITVGAGLPLPGPVVGMVLLFAALVMRGKVPGSLAKVGDGLLSNLSLLFVPAGVGIMQHAARFEDEAFAVGGALLASTLLTIAVTAFVMSRFTPRHSGGQTHAASSKD